MSPQTLTRPPQFRANARRRLAAVTSVIAVAVLVLGGSWVMRGPDFVERVTIENPTGFDVDVDVAGPDGRVLGLTQVQAGRTKEVRSVIDQGVSWMISFVYAGRAVGSVDVDRETLEGDDWRIEVPQEVERRLVTAGYEPDGE